MSSQTQASTIAQSGKCRSRDFTAAANPKCPAVMGGALSLWGSFGIVLPRVRWSHKKLQSGVSQPDRIASPVPVVSKNVIRCFHTGVTREPAPGVVPLWGLIS